MGRPKVKALKWTDETWKGSEVEKKDEMDDIDQMHSINSTKYSIQHIEIPHYLQIYL